MKFLCSQVLIALICCLYIADSSPVIESENLSEPKIPKPDELFEGDIAGIEKNERGAYQIPTKNVGLWSKGIVPYLIDPYSNFYSSEILTIKQALKQIEDSTRVYGNRVVRFDEIYESQTYRYSNYIRVIRGIGCYSYVGRQKNEKYQYLSLGFGCVTIGIIQHEFMHALGFFHEQSRPDRDDYVTIYYQNIQQGQEINFQRYTWNIVGLREFPYDYSSLMHYGTYEFSGNGLPTIVPKQLGVTIGQRIGLSTQDAAEIIAVYSSGKRSIFMGLEIMFISLSIWIISRVF